MAETGAGDFESVMEAGHKAFMAAFKRGDAAGVAALYAEDAQLLPPNADFVTGRAAVRASWQGLMDRGIKSMLLITGELEDHGHTAIDVGRYKLFGDGERELDQGKYIVILKQVDGQRKLHRDIFNSSNPPPGA
jgi:ketosteroid isomerase-like protein